MPRYARLPQVAPARLDMDVYRGDDLTLRLVLKTHGVPMVISKWSFRAYVREKIRDEEPITEFLVDIFNPTMGELRLALTAEQTALFPPKAVWDLEVTDSVGRVRTALRGAIETLEDVTYDSLEVRGGRRGRR